MNRSAIKSYAPKARLDFIRAVTARAALLGISATRTEAMQESGDFVLIGGRAWPRIVAQQRRSLEERIRREGFEHTMEAVAYTWFNRFAALRYMELHGFLDHGYRVLSHPRGKAVPELLEHAEHVLLPGLASSTVIELKLDGSRDAELYNRLLVAQCNALHKAMPFLFERVNEESELLLPDNLLHTGSPLRKLVDDIPEEDWREIEIVGWLYQFYISDRKAEVIGKVVRSEDIPAATQLFTPNWIVKYLVQNAIGRQWLGTYPQSTLRERMEYYIEPAGQTPEVEAQLAATTPAALDPEKLTLLDPACGSGHILVEGYELFKAIYIERGYRLTEIPHLILGRNLFGLEIDERAAQLAAFALLMKARADDSNFFDDPVIPNVLALRDSKGLDARDTEMLVTGRARTAPEFASNDLFPDTLPQLTLETVPDAHAPWVAPLLALFEHAGTFGSLLRVPPELARSLAAARRDVETLAHAGGLFEERVAARLQPLLRQCELLAGRYDAVVANPPYMGGKGMNPLLKSFAKTEYPDSKSDLFAMFIERGFDWCLPHGSNAMVTMQSWMFLSSYDTMRKKLLDTRTLYTMAHLGARAFSEISGEVVQTTAFVAMNSAITEYTPVFFRLIDGNEAQKQTTLLARDQRYASVQQVDFHKIPGSPVAYWASEAVRACFQSGKRVEFLAEPRQGLATSDNDRFIRIWSETSFDKLSLDSRDADHAIRSKCKWFPYAKGGENRKWYGNNYYVINWGENGREIIQYAAQLYGSPTRTIKNIKYYFREAITWSLTSSSGSSFSARWRPHGYLFDVNGMSSFYENDPFLVLCPLNSIVGAELLSVINPTMAFQAGDIKSFPILILESTIKMKDIGKECIKIAKNEWDSDETSWDFVGSPLLDTEELRDHIESSWNSWSFLCRHRITRLINLEEQNNRIFIEAYGLQDELSPEVPEEQITLTRADREQDMKRLLSYAIGCMMGRYSLDEPGLIYAHAGNEGFDAARYRSFPADPDGIVPLTEQVWFEDDATERFVTFIATAWPREHLEENLLFVAESLGMKRDEQARDTIRSYICTAFYKDHMQTYRKRPIYWLFSSGRERAFQCLVYLHRYNAGTLARMRTEYVIPLQGKLNARIGQLAGDVAEAATTAQRAKLSREQDTLARHLAELLRFDEKLRHYADKRIELDLDDGVKVNYAKFGDLLAEVASISGAKDE